MMRKIFFILLFFISSCGYQPIYLNSNIKNFEFEKIALKGDENINKKIIKTLSIKENVQKENKLVILSEVLVEPTSKDSKGKVKSFRTFISVNFEIKNAEDNTIRKKKFLKSFTYNNKKNKFELVEYQNLVEDNLIGEIISEIIIFLNS